MTEKEQIPTHGPNWSTTDNGSIILTTKIRDGDIIQPYGIIIRKVHRKVDGAPLIRVLTPPMAFNHNLNTFKPDYDRAIPAWFTPKEWLRFLTALKKLAPHDTL